MFTISRYFLFPSQIKSSYSQNFNLYISISLNCFQNGGQGCTRRGCTRLSRDHQGPVGLTKTHYLGFVALLTDLSLLGLTRTYSYYRTTRIHSFPDLYSSLIYDGVQNQSSHQFSGTQIESFSTLLYSKSTITTLYFPDLSLNSSFIFIVTKHIKRLVIWSS